MYHRPGVRGQAVVAQPRQIGQYERVAAKQVRRRSASIRFRLPACLYMGLESLLLALGIATHESTGGRNHESPERRVGIERHRPAVRAALNAWVERVGRSHRHRPARPHTLHHHRPPWNPLSDNRLNPRRNTPRSHPDLHSDTLSHRQLVRLVLDHCGIDDRRGGGVRQEVEGVRGRYAKNDRLGESLRCHPTSVPQADSCPAHVGRPCSVTGGWL